MLDLNIYYTKLLLGLVAPT